MPDIAARTQRPRRYLLVGLTCAAIHNLIMFATDWAGIHYLAGLVISFLVLAPAGYLLHSLYTFEKAVEPQRFLRFSATLLAGFPLNLVLMALFVSVVHLSVPTATAICTALLFLWNFVAARWAIVSRIAPATGNNRLS